MIHFQKYKEEIILLNALVKVRSGDPDAAKAYLGSYPSEVNLNKELRGLYEDLK
jgi:hypothetical protein